MAAKNYHQPEDTTLDDHVEMTCQALYKINKHAKKYARLADENYRKRKKTTAHYNSLRKEALYSLKMKTLKRLYDLGHHDRIEKHEIDERLYYCFYVNGWSYHSPVEEWKWGNPTAGEIVDEREIDEFEPDSESPSNISLKGALTYLKREFGRQFSANNHLDEERVTYGYRSYFVGWDYL